MTEQEEWIKCVCNGDDTTYCGRKIQATDWYFVAARHAKAAIAEETRMQPCPKCMNEIECEDLKIKQEVKDAIIFNKPKCE